MWKLCALVFFIASVWVTSGYQYETLWFKVPLDHFGYQRNETFKIKYLVNDSYWDRGRGPIFFYTGNEGQIEVFAKHTGFMWEIAEEFKAKIVFAEHRYYGESMPFGNKSLDREHIGYLTSAQALADYADLVNFLQGGELRPRYPVIAFGGSYGGMLAAYFRMKYPHMVTGAIAASAPVHQFTGMVSCDTYNNFVTTSFHLGSAKCPVNVRKSWELIRNVTSNPNNTLHKDWKLCDPVKDQKDVQTLVDFLTDMYSTLAMVNYPFPSDFLVPLPAYPVRVVCQYLNQSLTGDKLLEGIGKVLKVYTNYDGKSKCVDYKKGDDYGNLDATGWDYQACTEMIMPMCSNGKDDMFEPVPWNFTKFNQDCYEKYGVNGQTDAAWVRYGGDRLQAASNIVFSNGLLDPWAGGGIIDSVSESVVAVVIMGSAHHQDLMPAHEGDREPVLRAREVHKANIRKWIRHFNSQA